jgi:Lipocalin-like domain
MLRKAYKAVAAATILVGLTLTSAAAREANAIAGKWEVRAFYTEDVASKERHDVYGSHPIGTMQLLPDGHFNAQIRNKQPDIPMSVWEDVAYSLMPESTREISYGGTYRVHAETMFVHVTNVRHEGLVGTDAFDMSWDEGRSTAEEPRSFQLVTGVNRRDLLSIETLPMPNPNGTGNTIVGRIIWDRMPD